MSARTKRRRHTGGFTLLELVFAFAMVAVFSLLVLQAITRLNNQKKAQSISEVRARVSETTRGFAGMGSVIRSSALRDGTIYLVDDPSHVHVNDALGACVTGNARCIARTPCTTPPTTPTDQLEYCFTMYGPFLPPLGVPTPTPSQTPIPLASGSMTGPGHLNADGVTISCPNPDQNGYTPTPEPLRYDILGHSCDGPASDVCPFEVMTSFRPTCAPVPAPGGDPYNFIPACDCGVGSISGSAGLEMIQVVITTRVAPGVTLSGLSGMVPPSTITVDVPISDIQHQ